MENEIIFKYIEGTASDQEIEQVVRWLESDEKNMQEYLLLRKAFDVSLWTIPKSQQNENPKYIKLFREVLKIAAMFVLMLGTYHLVYSKWIKPAEIEVAQTIFTPEGQRAELTLSDGTKVWLNAKSTLVFPDKFIGKERKVKLTGEAYFDVARDENKQFIVEAQDYKVKVLGTEFNVKSYPQIGLFETSLIRGSVKVSSADNIEEFTLVPGDIIYAGRETLTKANLEDYDKFAWKEGILSIKDLSFKEILDKLSLYYDVEFTIRNKAVLDDKYEGKFWIQDGVDHILRVLQNYNKFTYTKDEMNHITIY